MPCIHGNPAHERQIAARYLRSRRSSRLLSLITVIAVGGVTVGVMALVVVLGVMNGLQTDLREKILVANPHLRVLTYDRGLRLVDPTRDYLRAPAQLRAAIGVRSPHAIQMATAIQAGCAAFVTIDRRLPSLPGLRVLQLQDY